MNRQRSLFVYRELMSGKSLTSNDIPDLSKTVAAMRRKGVKITAERLGFSAGKRNRYFMDDIDRAINSQNELKTINKKLDKLIGE